jgi:hypothetical protein
MLKGQDIRDWLRAMQGGTLYMKTETENIRILDAREGESGPEVMIGHDQWITVKEAYEFWQE